MSAVLKGINVSETENTAPLIIVEGKKPDGKNTVLTQITFANGESTSAPLAEGAVFSGTFEGITTKPAANGYPASSAVNIRAADGSLVRIKMSKNLQEAMTVAEQAGLAKNDAIEVQYLETLKLAGGKTFFKYAVQI
jgi:hypothetical protein